MCRLTPEQTAATSQSWPNLKPLPVRRTRLSLQRQFTEQEYQRICQGLIPQSMDDKWLMFAGQVSPRNCICTIW
jgi:hypothetical protein